MPFSTYMQSEIGHAEIEPRHPLEAGSHAELVITYTAGSFGIDDTGAIKISWRTASDAAKPQFTDPKAPNYTTAHATNGAALELEYNRNNIRPWVNTLFIRVGRGFLREGDKIVVRLGDRRHGSPGYRLQTAREKPFWFKVFVDAFATYDFVELPSSPTLELVPGPVVRWKAILPTLAPRRRSRSASRWSARTAGAIPASRPMRTLRLVADRPVEGLPETLEVQRRQRHRRASKTFACSGPGDLRIDLCGQDGTRLARSNPLRIAAEPAFSHYWGDLHGQSGETVGTGTAAEYYRFARDKAFLDIVGHQGNDFQIDDGVLGRDQPHRRRVRRARQVRGAAGLRVVRQHRHGRRSQRVLPRAGPADLPLVAASCWTRTTTPANDCHHVIELFEKLEGEDAVVIAHVGGRYADLRVGHDGRFERAVEVHSCWGTFEWLLHDAFELGHRVGVVCHSDDHKGRPGAAWPGAGQFGAIGGLTCYLMPRLDRRDPVRGPAPAPPLRHHRHAPASRCPGPPARRCPAVRATTPSSGRPQSAPAARAMMGDIVQADGEVDPRGRRGGLGADRAHRGAERQGAVATRRGYGEAELGRRIRVLFEGAEYRGRGREVFWRGHARLVGNRFERARRPINLFNADKPLRLAADGSPRWISIRSRPAISAGFDLWLADAACRRDRHRRPRS